MLNIFPDSIDKKILDKNVENIKSIHRVFKKYEKNKKEKTKIKDLFIVVNKNFTKIEIIKEWSFRGIWIKFKKKLADIFNTTSEYQENWDQVSKALRACLNKLDKVNLEAVIGLDKEFKPFLTELSNVYNIHSIGDVALPIINQPNTSKGKPFKATVGPITPDQSAKIGEIYRKFISGEITEVHESIEKMFPKKFLPEEKNEMVRALMSKPNLSLILEAANKGDRDLFLKLLNIEMLNSFKLAEKEKIDLYDHILYILRQEIPPSVLAGKTPTLKNLALILGDGFIKDSEYEGDINSKEYSEIFVDYLKNHHYDSTDAARLTYNLNKILDFTSKDYDAKQMRKKILETIKKCPPGPKGERSCVFVGGWVKHAILYEIEQKSNGKYVFRVFNQGAGIENHIITEFEGRKKILCFASCDEIDEEVILRPSFLAQIMDVTERQEGENYLYDLMYSQLGTKAEPIEDYHFTYGQRSGTCVFQSFWAYIKHKLGPNDSKRCDLEFKAHVLAKFLPEAIDRTSQAIPDYSSAKASDYASMQKEYNVLRHTIQKFSRDLGNAVGLVDQDKYEKANELILEYQVVLKKFERRMEQLSTETINSKSFHPILAETFSSEKIDKSEKNIGIDSETFSPRLDNCLALIETIQPDSNGKISGDLIINILNPFFKNQIRLDYETQKEIKVLLDRLFKKIGPIANFKKITCSTDETIKLLSLIQSIQLSYRDVSMGQIPIFSPHDKASLSVAAYYLGECLFNQLPLTEKVLLGDNPSFLSDELLKNLKEMDYLDPYWSDFVHDLDQEWNNVVKLKKDFNLPNHILSEDETKKKMDKKFHLDKKWINSIVKFWDSKPKSFHDSVAASIKADRAEQERQIALQIKLIESQVAGINKEIKDSLDKLKIKSYDQFLDELRKRRQEYEYLKKSLKYDEYHKALKEMSAFKLPVYKKNYEQAKQVYDKLKNNFPNDALTKAENHFNDLNNLGLERKESQKRELELSRSGVRDNVEQDPKYWPKGWEHGKKSDDFKAKFIFGKRDFFRSKLLIQDVLPESFRDFFLSATLAYHAFYKSPIEANAIDYPNCFALDENKKPILKIKGQQNERQELSLIRTSLTEGWPVIFSKIKQFGNTTENHAPSRIQKFLTDSKLVPPMVSKAPGKKEDKTKENKILDFSKLMTVDELREAYASTPHEVRIESVLSYFTTNWDKLENQNWLLLLTYMLFDSHILADALADPEQHDLVVKQVDQFFDNIKENAIIKGNFSLIANLMMVKGCFKHLLIHQTEKINEKEKIIQSCLDEVEKLLELGLNKKNEYHRPILLEGLAAYCGQVAFIPGCETDPDIPVLINLLKNQTIVSESPLAIRRILASELGLKINKYFTNYRGDIDKVVSQRFKQLLVKIFPSLQQLEQDKTQLDYFRTSDGMTGICLSAGLMASKNPDILKSFASKPNDVITQLLLTNKLYTQDQINDLRCSIQGNQTYIFNSKTNTTLIYDKKKSEFFTEIEIEGKKEWTKFIKPSSKETKIYDRYVSFSKGFKYYLCEPNTFKVKYECGPNDPIKLYLYYYLQDCESKLYLGSSDRAFRHFEDPAWSRIWLNKKEEVESIEFPRMDLTFIKNDQNGRLELKGNQEWFIPYDQYCPQITHPTGYLTMENDSGQKKVLLPILSSLSVAKQPFNFPYTYDFDSHSDDDSIRYVECDIDNDVLIPKTVEGRYWLAYLYMEKGFTHLAEELLFSIQAEVATRALSDQERKILERIVYGLESKQVNSPSIRSRLHAFYLLERDAQTYRPYELKTLSKDIAIERLQIKRGLYVEYLTRLGHVQALDKREEELILKTLTKEGLGLDSLISHRKKMFEGDAKGSLPAAQVRVFRPLKYGTSQGAPQSDLFGSISIKKIKDYRAARKKNEFPFDCMDPFELKDGIKEYYALLLAEATFSTNASLRKNGLLSLCSLAALRVQDSEELRNIMFVLKFKFSKTEKKAGKVLEPKRSSSFIEEEVQQMNILSHFQSAKDESSFLSQLRHKYLETRPSAPLNDKGISEVNLKVDLFSNLSKEYSNAAEKMKEDVKEAGAQLANVQNYHETQYPLSQLEVQLTEKIKEEKKYLLEQEQLILNTVHSSLMAPPKSASKFRAGRRFLPNIQELAILASKTNSDAAIKKLYPELSKEAVQNLQTAMKKYLIQKQFVQHLDRSSRKLIDISKENDVNNRQLLLNEFGKILDAKREYQIDEPLSMAFLTLETILDIRLRQDQITRIKEFYDSENSDTDLVVQMIMGAGKTSIIQPLLALLFAKPTTLSSVTLPVPLFPSVTSELSNLLGKNYKQLVFSDAFARENAKSAGYIATYLERLEDAKSRGGVVVVTPQHKYAIYSSLKEAYFSKDKTRADLLAKICHLLEISELTQIDEIDMVMDPTIIYKFPVGAKKRIDSQRATAITNMMTSFLNDKELQEKISFDFVTQFRKRQNPNYTSKGIELSTELYESTVKPKLIDYAFIEMENIFKMKSIKGKLKDFAVHFLGQTTPYDQTINAFNIDIQNQTMNQLLQKKDAELKKIASREDNKIDCLIAQKLLFMKERNQAIMEGFNERERECLGAMAKSISLILKNSLFEEGGVHYSNDPIEGIYTVRPYYAPNSPKTCVPSDPYEMLIKSIQNVYYNGIPRHAVTKMMKQFQKTVVDDMGTEGIKIAETEGYKKFKKILGDQAEEFDFFGTPPKKELIDILHKKMNVDPASHDEFIKELVFPQIGYYEKSIETTPQAMVGLSRKAFGYTGTINPGILSRLMKAISEKGTDGKTITAVSNKISEGTSGIMTLESSAKKSYLDQVIQQFKNDKDYHVYIDSGNWLKEEVIEIWAEKLLNSVHKKRNGIQGVVYPNALGEWQSLEYLNGKLELIPLSRSQLKPHQRLTIIPSKHETGTNIPQIPTAKAFETIRKDMTLRDALQSIFRMRQILEGQQIVFGISKEVKEHIALHLFQSLIKGGIYKEYMQGNKGIDDLPETNSLEQWIKDACRKSKSKDENEIFSQACDSFDLKNHQEYMWNYFLENQTDDQFDKNVRSLDHKMIEVLEKPIRMVLTDTKVPYEQRQKLFDAMGEFFVPSQKDSPFTEMTRISSNDEILNVVKKKEELLLKGYSKLMSSKTVSKDILNTINKNINTLYDKGEPKEVLKATIQACIQKDLLPQYVKSSEFIAEIEQEQEEEIEQEVQIDINVQLSQQVLKENPYAPFSRAKYTDEGSGWYVPSSLIKAYFKPISGLIKNSKLRKLIEKVPLEYSSNLFMEGHLPSDYYLPGLYLLMTRDEKGKERYVLVTHEDAAKIKTGLRKHRDPIKGAVALITFNGDIIAQSGKANLNVAPDKIQKMALFGRLLTGKVNFKKEEIQHLDDMIESSGDPEGLFHEVKKVFESVLALKEGELRKFPLSPINKYFQRKIRQHKLKKAPAAAG